MVIWVKAKDEHCSLGLGRSAAKMLDLDAMLVMHPLTPHMAIRDILAAEGSMAGGGPPRPFVAVAGVNRSGDSNPADGGGDGMGVTIYGISTHVCMRNVRGLPKSF